jgi:hypothetical protein
VRPPSRPGVVLALVLSAVVALLLGWATVSALRAADALEQARADLSAATSASQAPAEAVLDSVARADQRLADARAHLDNPAVAVVSRLPVLGRSWRVEIAVVDAATAVLAPVEAVESALPALRRPGGVDLAALDRLLTVLEPAAQAARRAQERLAATSTAWTPPPVRRGAEEAEESLAPAVDAVTRATAVARLATGLLGGEGDRQVLVCLMNNAELFGVGGNVSSFATGRTTAGRLELSPFRDTVDVADPPERARRVPADPELVEDYGVFLADTTLWRTWGMSPDVPAAAPVAAAAAGVLLGTTPDVVVLLDVPAMVDLIALTGQPLQLPDGAVVPTDQLADALLVDSYERAGDRTADQDARRNALQAAAGRAATSLLSGAVSPLETARTLGRLVSGGRVAVWSGRPREQALLEQVGAAGAVGAPQDGDLAHVGVNNLNGTKLDRYVERQVEVDVVVGPQVAEVVQRVRLVNAAPEDLVPYVAGTAAPGTLDERVELSASPRASVTGFTHDGRPPRGGVRRGEERTRAHAYIGLPRGDATELELRYEVPVEDGRYRLRVLPQPLAVDATLDLQIDPVQGTRVVRREGAPSGPSGGVLVSQPLSQRLDVVVQVEVAGD